jgi:predicted DNA-binding transcriptional regulator AlpA
MDTIDLPALLVIMRRSESSARRDWKAGRLPRPFRIGRNLKWLRSDIESFLRKKADEAQTPAAANEVPTDAS